MRKLSCLAFCALALALALWGAWLSVSAVRPTKVTVSFVGFATNTSVTFKTSEGTFPVTSSIFRVSNSGSRRVVLLGFYSHESKGDPTGPDTGLDVWAPEICTLLNPGEIKAVSVMTPWMIKPPWRVVFQFTAYGWRQRFQDLPPWQQIMPRPLVTDRQLLNYPTENVASDWIASTARE